MKIDPKFHEGDMVVFRFVKQSNRTYNGVILSSWTGVKRGQHRCVYTIASMNHGMCSYSVGEEYIEKKIA